MSTAPFLRRPQPWFQRFDLGDLLPRSLPRFLLPLESFDPTTLGRTIIRSVDGGGHGGGGTGGGTGAGGGVAPGAAAGAASPATSATAGAGTAGVGNLLPWLYPTADFRNFDKGPSTIDNNGNPTGVVALPAIGATSTILQFRVDNGRAGKITQMGIDFVANGGAVWTQGILPAQLTFSLTADGKAIFRDYEQFQFSPGAVSAPTPINGLMLREGQVIVLTVKNISIVVTTQFLSARLLGYTFSEALWPKIMGAQ